MPVELRKRKAPEPAPAPAPKKASSKVAKAAEKVKGAVKGKAEKPAEKPVEKVTEKPVEKPAAANGSGKKVKAVKGETIDLDGFGGDIETNDGEKTTLKELVDKSKAGVVLFTYPKASTPGCTKQACLFRDSYEPLTKTGFAIYGLSMDSPKANTTFKEKQKLPYPLLCDPKATLIAAIGLKKPPKSTQRGVFVVDKAGKVLIAEPGSPAGTVDVVTALIEGGDVDGAEEAATEAPAADAKEEEEAANGEVKADEEKKEDAADEAEKKDEKKDDFTRGSGEVDTLVQELVVPGCKFKHGYCFDRQNLGPPVPCQKLEHSLPSPEPHNQPQAGHRTVCQSKPTNPKSPLHRLQTSPKMASKAIAKAAAGGLVEISQKHTLQSTGIWERIRRSLAIDPNRSSGVPLNPTFRNPAPGANDPLAYDDPVTVPAGDIADNPYWKRDARRNYPAISVVNQADVVGLLAVGSAANPRVELIGEAGEKALVAAKEEGKTTGIAAYLEKNAAQGAVEASKEALFTNGLPPTPSGENLKSGKWDVHKYKVNEEQTYGEGYPCRTFA
ncbi:AhpC/TSA family protein [Colletotrichum abscissum]|uniref:thioredoxin-dependent peroxiredoxin n=1 Tax=Colletotrichum abscissum TaxID=1671311 RepID=A0A9P9XGQ5_9PEZI|nr:AhpC/TSA family protein [Colletotrichum abscissum]KAI3553525.1 AhpC/TSA family protein [Colletotrichum abscissum]KAK1491792.1 AhpC/TSA family protein [Colletotrichum abscissum]